MNTRIGAVSFINTKPLVEGLDTNPTIELTYDLPGILADELRSGSLDAALIPVVEFLRGVGTHVVPGISIASRGKVKSVRLLSRMPAEELTSIAVDQGSRTSVALLRILLAEKYHILPDFHVFSPERGEWFERYPAVLVIGDQALREVSSAEHVYDLGQLWNELTGLPFVFAFWVYRDREKGEALTRLLGEARQAGLEHLEAIAERAALRKGFEPETVLAYLRDHLHYDLGPEEIRGLELFNEYCLKYHLVPRDRLSERALFRVQSGVAS